MKNSFQKIEDLMLYLNLLLFLNNSFSFCFFFLITAKVAGSQNVDPTNTIEYQHKQNEKHLYI